MIPRIAVLTALALVTACSASAGPYATPYVAPAAATPAPPAEAAATVPTRAGATCDIRTTRTARSVRIDAVAHAQRAFTGRYELLVRSSGGANASDIVQQGPVDFAPGAVVTLASSEIGAAHRGHTDIILTLRDANGVVCHLERRL